MAGRGSITQGSNSTGQTKTKAGIMNDTGPNRVNPLKLQYFLKITKRKHEQPRQKTAGACSCFVHGSLQELESCQQGGPGQAVDGSVVETTVMAVAAAVAEVVVAALACGFA